MLGALDSMGARRTFADRRRARAGVSQSASLRLLRVRPRLAGRGPAHRRNLHRELRGLLLPPADAGRSAPSDTRMDHLVDPGGPLHDRADGPANPAGRIEARPLGILDLLHRRYRDGGALLDRGVQRHGLRRRLEISSSQEDSVFYSASTVSIHSSEPRLSANSTRTLILPRSAGQR
jgi:hypothetical protein